MGFLKNFLTSLFASSFEKQIKDLKDTISLVKEILGELKDLKNELSFQATRIKKYREFDKIVEKHSKLIQKASTPEEVKAHVQRLYADRARLDL